MSFTVVGEFSSTEAAEKAHRQFYDFFNDIQETQVTRLRQTGYTQIPTWPEVEMMSRYGINWDESFDWIDDINRQVTLFRNYVFVTTNFVKTYQDSDPIVVLMEKVASSVFVKTDQLPELIILTKVECIAPEYQVAITVKREINLYLKAKDVEFLIPPWEEYCPKLELSDHKLLRKPFDVEVDCLAVQRAVRALYRYQKARMDGPLLLKPEEEVIAALYTLRDHGYILPHPLNGELLAKLIHSTGGISASSALGAEVKTVEQRISMPEIFFFRPESGIPAIYGYLENEGCTDIELSLKSVPYASKPEYI